MVETEEKKGTGTWVKIGRAEQFPVNAGIAILHEGEQIAVYNFQAEGRWFATQNQCPHKKDMILARGMLGDAEGTPKVACPMHKKTFSLEDGHCISDPEFQVKVYPIKEENGEVFLQA